MGKIKLGDDLQRAMKPAEGESKSLPIQRRRESPSGYHYYSLFKECPRKWYIKYVLGLRPRFTSPPLLFGGAIHEGVAAYYQNGFDIDALINTFESDLTARKDEYESKAKYLEDVDRGKRMLDTWVSTWRDYDQEMVEILEVEKEYTISIGPAEAAFDFTIRPDRAIRRLDDQKIIIPDVKTTGWSITKSMDNARFEDQLTSYVWGWNKTHEEKAEAAQVDVLYAKGNVTGAERSEDIIISSFAQKQFEMGLYGLISDITTRVLNLEHYPWPLLFPRNGRVCGLFGCEYEHLCRENIQPGSTPEGFIRDEWVEIDQWLKRAQAWKEEKYKL